MNLQRWKRRLSTGLLILAATVSAFAEQGILVVHVKDVQRHPVMDLEIGTEGEGSTALTDKTGLARIRLAPQTKARSSVSLQIVASPPGKDLVMVSPWESRTLVPSFENESENFVDVVVANRGDRAMMESRTAVVAIVARINKAKAPKISTEKSVEEQRQSALTEVSGVFGLKPEEVDRAIRVWSKRTDDPYEKGLAALYEEKYPEATLRLSESLQIRKNQLARTQADVADAAFFLGASLYEQGRYRESIAAYQEAENILPNNTHVLNCLGLSLFMAGDYEGAEPLYRRALAISEKALGPDHPHVATILNDLAMLLEDKGDRTGAEPLYRRALAISEKALGPDHPQLATILHNLGERLAARSRQRSPV